MLSTQWTREQKSRVACPDAASHLRALLGHDLEVPGAGDHKSGRMDGKKCRILGRLYCLVRKKDFELLNCGLPWTEVQAGLQDKSAGIKSKANAASKCRASSFTPLIFSECGI